MRFVPSPLPGAIIVELEPQSDERGFFARSWCQTEFEAHGLNPRIVQCNVAFNRKKGTLRGMHYQVPPHAECKLVRCTAGAIYDVLVDCRDGSATRYFWFGIELAAENRRIVYVPEGFAHGYQSLVDNSEVFYQVSQSYEKDAQRGLRWDDPAISIRWPLKDPILSEQDKSFP